MWLFSESTINCRPSSISGQRHHPGDAAGDRLQFRRRRAREIGKIYKITLAMAGVIMAAGTVLCLYDLQHADRCLYRQRGDHRSRAALPSDHQRRIHRLNGLRNSVWCPGGNRHGCPVPCDLLSPLYRSHPSVCLYSLPSVQRRRGLERVLDHGVCGSSCS